MKMYRYILLICILSFPFQFGLSQSIEQAWDLSFSPLGLRNVAYCRSSIDSTQMTDDGSYPVRIKFNKEKVWYDLLCSKENGCFFDWSRTVVLPEDAGEKVCTVTLNCKSEVDSLWFVVIALSREDNELCTDSLIIPSTGHWADYSLSFLKKGVRAVQILIRYKGDVDVNEGRSIYLNRIKIKEDDQELNNLPISSLVPQEKMQFKSEVIIPLSFQEAAFLGNVPDWKNKKIIALGEQIRGIRDLRAVQIQLMKHLITSENCKLILLELPEDFCVRWNLYLQGKQPDPYGDQLIGELKSSLHNYRIFLEFLKWVRQYNMKAIVPVRIAGIADIGDFGFRNRRNIFLTDYLLKLSTNRQDSVYYTHAMDRHEYPQVKEYILKSERFDVLNEQDFQYLLFLMDELIHAYNISRHTDAKKESDLDKSNRIQRILKIYLSPAGKAVFIAPSERINKRIPIRDSYFESDLLGSHLYEKYGEQYHAVCIQIGERTCLADTIASDSINIFYYKKNGIPWIYPVDKRPLFPFSFERAGMDSQISCFYYPSTQLPEGILGLNLYYDAFKYCYVPSHFDALVFIREAKASWDMNSYPRGLSEFAKDIGLHLDDLLEKLKE